MRQLPTANKGLYHALYQDFRFVGTDFNGNTGGQRLCAAGRTGFHRQGTTDLYRPNGRNAEGTETAACRSHRNEELNTLIKKLYEGNATGKIPDKHFERLLADYDREQTALETEIEDLQEQIDSFDEDNTKADKFIAVVRRYTDFTELTTPMLNEFIEKVVVHEATGGRTDRKQKIDVYFNFVGQVELPPDRA